MKTRKLFYGLVACIFLGGLIAVMAARPSAAQPSDPVEVLRQQTDGTARVSYHAETGKVSFIGADQSHPMPQPVALKAEATAEEAARQFLGAYGSAFGLVDQTQELSVKRSNATEDGRSVVRFQQVYRGIPVLGGELIVNMNAGKNVLSVSGETLPDIKLDTNASLDADSARQQAIAAIAKEYALSADDLVATTPELWVFNPALLGGPGPRLTNLVWRMDVTSIELLPIRELVLLEAHTGAVVLHFNQVEAGLNRTVYDNQNVRSEDLSLNPAVCTEGNCPGSGDDTNFAYNFAGDTYNFYWDNHSRDSIDGVGMAIISTVRYCPTSGLEDCPYPNAFWNGQQMVYGQGFASGDDVVGHEMTHGVTDKESSLFYYYQSGAINESLSDVWGEFIDQDNAYDGSGGSVKWLMGEDLPIGAIRSMSDPTIYGDPDRMGSPNYYCAESHAWNYDNGGVHTNSGVNNKAAYLMTDGGSFNGQTVVGLGLAKVADIYYEVQTNLFTSASDYQALYDGLIQACTNLVGGIGGITAGDCQEVQKAVLAVQMNTQPSGCAAPEAPVCAVGQTPTNIFFDNLETTGSGNWSSGPVSGSVNEWYYPQNPNPYWDATFGTSGVFNLFGIDINVTGDYAMAMNNNVLLPAGTSYLYFRHSYAFEANDTSGIYYDGGVLEYSAGGGAWTDAGSLFLENGYTGSISSGDTNPIGGRSAFTTVSYGYISSRLNLSSLAGQNVKFRFRIGTDSTGWDLGWYIDDIRIYTCGTAATPTATTTRTPTPTRTATPPGWTPLPTLEKFLPVVRKDLPSVSTPTPTATATPTQPTPTVTSTVPPSLPGTIYAAADACVVQAYPGENFGDTIDILVGYDDMYNPDMQIMRGLIGFDLSAIPAWTTINNATLYVYYMGYWDYPNYNRTITPYRITSSWSEMGVTWNNQPSIAEAYGTASIAANDSWRYVAFNVTNLVNGWVNGGLPNYGIMLRGPEVSGLDSSWREFSTLEGAYTPYLAITYGGRTSTFAPQPEQADPQGSSILDILPGRIEAESCLDQSPLTKCFIHR